MWKILGYYNYKGSDYITMYRIKKDGQLVVKNTKLTKSGTDSEYFTKSELNEDFLKIFY